MVWLYDSHIHLSDPYYEKNFQYILNFMKKKNFKAFCVSENLDTSKRTLKISQNCPLIYSFVGIHPEHAKDSFSSLEKIVSENHQDIDGIGEIGLDKTYLDSNLDFQTQKDLFINQLSLAEKFQKPISVHSRKTVDLILELLPSFSISKVLFHWFEGNKKQLSKLMDFDYFVSFGPVMVYSKDKQVILSKTNRNNILFETDGPVKFSHCFGLKNADVSFIPSVLWCASKVLRTPFDQLSIEIQKNCERFLGI